MHVNYFCRLKKWKKSPLPNMQLSSDVICKQDCRTPEYRSEPKSVKHCAIKIYCLTENTYSNELHCPYSKFSETYQKVYKKVIPDPIVDDVLCRKIIFSSNIH